MHPGQRVASSAVKLLFKPMALFAGVVAARVAQAAFQSLWSMIYDGDPPTPTTAETTTQKVVAAAVLQAATQAAIGALATRVAAQTFIYLFGVWPGKEQSAD